MKRVVCLSSAAVGQGAPFGADMKPRRRVSGTLQAVSRVAINSGRQQKSSYCSGHALRARSLRAPTNRVAQINFISLNPKRPIKPQQNRKSITDYGRDPYFTAPSVPGLHNLKCEMIRDKLDCIWGPQAFVSYSHASSITVYYLHYYGLLISLFSHPEDGGDMFLRSIG
jgi:hypothetical protein